MSPSQLSSALKRIASQIEASKKPNKELVIRDLKNVISAMNEPKFFKLDSSVYETVFVVVDPDQDKVWEDTLRYLNDVGIDPVVTPMKPVPRGKCHTPGDVSDLLAPRDD